MITWKDNKLRWIFFYYFVGLIVACLTTFLEEVFFPLPVRYLYKSLNVTIFTPVLVVVLWTYWRNRQEG